MTNYPLYFIGSRDEIIDKLIPKIYSNKYKFKNKDDIESNVMYLYLKSLKYLFRAQICAKFLNFSKNNNYYNTEKCLENFDKTKEELYFYYKSIPEESILKFKKILNFFENHCEISLKYINIWKMISDTHPSLITNHFPDHKEKEYMDYVLFSEIVEIQFDNKDIINLGLI